jgi:hypothetical protein
MNKEMKQDELDVETLDEVSAGLGSHHHPQRPQHIPFAVRRALDRQVELMQSTASNIFGSIHLF